jgi:voltage-gated potassium channel
MTVLSEPAAPEDSGWRARWFQVVFRNDTPAGILFDISLIALILVSVVVAMLDSVGSIHARYGGLFNVVEWGVTVLFTIEYLLRLVIVRAPLRYALSFYGLIDIAAVLPTYLALIVPGTEFLIVVRVLRILRIFKILHLHQYVREGGMLISALTRSARKIFVFLLTIMTIVTIFGVIMYLVEGPENGFTSIPTSMYWAVVTVATVGFGDIAPVTGAGRFAASVLILIGYGIIAVPTGIYTAELMGAIRKGHDARTCPSCSLIGHDEDAHFCRRCGAVMDA